MAEVSDRVRLTGMRFSAVHGVYEFERITPQPFVVDVTCHLMPRPAEAGASPDDLATTVDYADLSGRIAAVVTGEPVNLIETLAERIAAICLDHPLVATADVTVHKPEAQLPVDLADMSITLTRSRIR